MQPPRSRHEHGRGATAAPGEGARALKPASVLRGLLATFTVQDAILLGYIVVLLLLLSRVAPGPAVAQSARALYACLVPLVIACVVARREGRRPALLGTALYRAVLVGTIAADYAILRDLLPVLRVDTVDGALMRLDVTLFGVEPTLWLERFNTRGVVEYFSFFYLSYFWIAIGMAVITYGFLRPSRATTEFTIGTALVYCVGQIGYVAVPGYGPIHALANQFHAPLDGGFFWGAVSATVSTAGAGKDVFPSLHTAVPLWFALHGLRRACEDARWRLPAAALAFFSLNIIASTLVLRWHYGVDILAGVALAAATALAAPALAAWEESFRRTEALPAVW
jgi:hypothetical protein